MVAQENKLSWTFNPRLQEPFKFGALILLIAAFSAVVYFTSDTARWWWTGLSALLLVLMTLPYFVPITYELTDEGVSVFHGRIRSSFKPWSHYTRCVYDEVGLQLKTMEVDSRLDHYRGCFMRFAKGAKEQAEVIEFIGRKLKVVRNRA
ncbi:MAG: hypothetical protein HRF49_05440 [bacterium]|jgi:hypothetical protein